VTNRLLIALTLAALPLVACYDAPSDRTGESSAAIGEACGETTWTLTAGQTIDVGSVTVSNDANNVYVTYTLTYPDATFGNLHAWVGNSLLNLPANPQGIPVPGQFCQADGGACADATGLTSYTFTIPFADLNIVDASQVCGLPLFVVTHAEVNVDSDGDGTAEQQTAFGGNTPGTGPRWWFYGQYQVCCDSGNPDPVTCQTAFAKGGWVWTTDRKSNPESLPSLRLTKNRWGWAINLTSMGHSEYPIYAGAGLNNIANGTLVGRLYVDWDGTFASVRYEMNAGYDMEEVHLYAADGSPLTIAPGQYGNLDSFDPGVSTYTFTVSLADANLTGGVWLVAHAEVCH
jgi:hypothetical protein